MHIIRKRRWEIPAGLVTPEHLVLQRRALLAGASTLVAASPFAAAASPAPTTTAADAAAVGATAPIDRKYQAGRPLTAEKWATTYNNYYEFNETKNIWRDAQVLPQRPWAITLDGLVAKPRTIAIDDLLKQVSLEERIYRHRCVEAWAMTVPWTGFQLSQLLKIAEPQASAKYVVFQSEANPKLEPGLNAPFYPWPYVEGLTMAEAANEMTFISTGLFGKPLPPQNGGPIRLTLPWKYGFKSAKAIVKISFTDKRPATFWATLNPNEYGFWANVNPAVPHPRWSQATERLIGTDERVPTQIFNGYAEEVAALYTGLKNEKLFM